MVKEGHPIATPRTLFRRLKHQLLDNEIVIVQKQRLRCGPTLIGEVDRADDIIYMRRGLSPDEKGETLVHEFLHHHYEDYPEEIITEAGIDVYQRLSPRQKGFLQAFLQNEKPAR